MSGERHSTVLDYLFENGINVRARQVYLHHDMNHEKGPADSAITMVVRGLEYLDRSPGEITLSICTPGGSVSQMFGLFDTIKGLKNHVTTIGFGRVYSAGCLILAAGDHRLVRPSCLFMWHDIQVDFDGQLWELENYLPVLLNDRNRWTKAMGECTRPKKSAKFWHDLITKGKGETYYDAKQMVSHGIVDEIL